MSWRSKLKYKFTKGLHRIILLCIHLWLIFFKITLLLRMPPCRVNELIKLIFGVPSNNTGMWQSNGGSTKCHISFHFAFQSNHYYAFGRKKNCLTAKLGFKTGLGNVRPAKHLMWPASYKISILDSNFFLNMLKIQKKSD